MTISKLNSSRSSTIYGGTNQKGCGERTEVNNGPLCVSRNNPNCQ